ncbi:MAG: malate permease [Thermotogaceae bacterium]|nr:malate permease [Thermotogaceae bacterium]MDN5337528.1 malate permease [Thermotogaceae bacterium]
MIKLPAYDTILSVAIIFFLGFFIGKIYSKLSIKLLSKLSIWIFTTTVNFVYLNDNPIPLKLFIILVISNLLVLSLIFFVWFIIGKFSKHTLLNFLLTAFSNTGYIGYPIFLGLFGEKGLGYAVAFSVPHSFILATVGVAILSLSAKEKFSHDLIKAIKKVFKMPWIYAIFLAAFCNWIGFSWRELPKFLRGFVDMLRSASIPMILLTVGLEMSRVVFSADFFKKVGFNTIFKLFIAPTISLPFVFLFKFDSLMAKIFILQFAMPTAVNSAIIAADQNVEPEYASFTVFSTTVFSFISLGFWVWLIEKIGV